MSGAGKAGLVLGLITSTITILDTAQGLYNAAGEGIRLPEKLRVTAEQIPLISDILKLAERDITANIVSEHLVFSAAPVLERCKKNSIEIKDLFEEIIPAKDASLAERAKKHVDMVMKSDRVKQCMEELAKNLQILAHNQVFQDGQVLEDIKAAVEKLNDVTVEHQQPRIVHSGLGAINTVTGKGTQQVNSGSGYQYTAETQVFGRDQVDSQINFTYHYSLQEDRTKLTKRHEFVGSYAHSSLLPVHFYVTRPKPEQKLREALGAPNPIEQTRTIAVWGLGGAGKSQLILNFIQTHRQDYRRIFWVDAHSKETIERDYLQIHKLLLPNVTATAQPVRIEDVVVQVKSWFDRQEGQSLWVMDSVDEIEDETSSSYVDLNWYLPNSPGIDRIITSRSSLSQAISSQGGFPVRELEEDEAVMLFCKCAKLSRGQDEIDKDDRSEVLKIVKELGQLALAVTLAGSYVGQIPQISSNIRLYLPGYQENRKRLLSRNASRNVDGYSGSVLSAWEMSLDAINRRSALAARLLNILAFLHPEDIFLRLFKIPKSGSSGYGLPGFNWMKMLLRNDELLSSYDIEEGFGILQAYSMVQWCADSEAYKMHRLVHAWSQDRLDMVQRRAWSLAVASLLGQDVLKHDKNWVWPMRMFPHVAVNFSAFSAACSAKYPVRVANRRSISRLAEFLGRLGRENEEFGMRKFLVQTLSITQGHEHPSTLMNATRLAWLLGSRGDYEQAEKIYRYIVSVRTKILSPRHPKTLEALSGLGQTLYLQGNYQAAERIHRETLELRKSILGPEHPSSLLSAEYLAWILFDRGQYEQAREVYRQIGEWYRQTCISYQGLLEREHFLVLSTMNHLAQKLHEESRHAEVEGILRNNLKLLKHIRGPEHPHVLISTTTLGDTLFDQGKYTEAEEKFRQVFEMSERILGTNHSFTLGAMTDLADALASVEKVQEGEEMHRQAVSLSRKTFGNSHVLTLQATNSLAVALGRQGKYKESEELHRSALKASRKVLGFDHPSSLRRADRLVFVLICQRKYEQAQKVIQQTLDMRTMKLGYQHTDTLQNMDSLARILVKQRKYQLGQEMHQKTLDLRKDILGHKHPQTLTSKNNLAQVLISQGQLMQGEALHRENVVLCNNVLGPLHIKTLMSIGNYATVLLKLGQIERSKALLELKHKLLKKKFGRKHQETLKNWKALVRVRKRLERGKGINDIQVKGAERLLATSLERGCVLVVPW